MSRKRSRVRKFFSYYRPYLGLFSADMACAVIASAAMLAIPFCVRYITANSTDAQLIHEAAIGKIAGDQLLKLQTLGLTEEEAEDTILKGFLA